MVAALKLVHPIEDLDALRWQAVLDRDASADGQFWSCVKTTGVYCRPSCAGRPLRKNVRFVETRAEAEAAGFRPCKRCRPDQFIGGDLVTRLGEINRAALIAGLNKDGWAKLGRILNDEECAMLINAYKDEQYYRSKVIMQRYGFGQGEYRYYNDNAPSVVTELRSMLYEKVAPIANEWAEALGEARRFPERHSAYRRHCASAGQTRPTPLILKYGPGDYNRLHQDLYGDEVFPIQVAILLSAPSKEFEGGEFVMTEQSPRRQSRVMAPPLEKGDAIAFAVNDRPVAGAKGVYRTKMRHGVSEVRAGARYCLGIIFHDAS